MRRKRLIHPTSTTDLGLLYFEMGAGAAPPTELAIIVGDRDSFAPLSLPWEQMPRWHPAARLQVWSGVDPFFRSGLARLAEPVAEMLHGA